MDFLRHKFLEWTEKNKRATFGSTLRPFQSVEISLHWLLPSRANVRFAQHSECNKELNPKTTDTVYRTEPFLDTVYRTDSIVRYASAHSVWCLCALRVTRVRILFSVAANP